MQHLEVKWSAKPDGLLLKAPNASKCLVASMQWHDEALIQEAESVLAKAQGVASAIS